jgi:hypothetical protein
MQNHRKHGINLRFGMEALGKLVIFSFFHLLHKCNERSRRARSGMALRLFQWLNRIKSSPT